MPFTPGTRRDHGEPGGRVYLRRSLSLRWSLSYPETFGTWPNAKNIPGRISAMPVAISAKTPITVTQESHLHAIISTPDKPASIARTRQRHSRYIAEQAPIAASNPDTLLHLPTVIAMTGLSRSTIYARQDFPRPVRLSARCVRWRAGDVLAWLAAQVNS